MTSDSSDTNLARDYSRHQVKLMSRFDDKPDQEPRGYVRT
ncbi:BQ5605_C037g11608 [Microbotryum silenes-dioicae]|uniref:BQ5605_C037g11608 protein n=1 Tax=Microbotryum silenes-dioicae TaxID=796604 RepID=A0A2X0PGX1_9BASI|nr:BQ5605_C037g11608 [Microbotryum silenes-dioicae]